MAKELKEANLEGVSQYINDINQEELVIGEGKKHFDTSALPEIQKIMGQYKGIDDFIDNASLSEKMSMSQFLNTGEWEKIPDNWITSVDSFAKGVGEGYGDITPILRPFVGMDTRGLETVSVGIGKHLDIFAFEDKINQELRNWLNPNSVGGTSWKSGRVFQRLQDYFTVGKPKSVVGIMPRVPIVDELFDASAKSIDELRDRISNVRYGRIEGERGFILFDFNGKTYEAPELGDYVLTGTDKDKKIALRQFLDRKAKPIELVASGTLEVENTIPKELEPLAEEAGEYTDVEDWLKFDKNKEVSKILIGGQNLLPSGTDVNYLDKMEVLRAWGGDRSDMDIIRDFYNKAIAKNKQDVLREFKKGDRVSANFFDSMTMKNRRENGIVTWVRNDGLVEVEVEKPIRKRVSIPVIDVHKLPPSVGRI